MGVGMSSLGEPLTLTRFHRWGTLGLGAVLLTWCVSAALTATRDAIGRPIDPMADIEAEFLPFIPHIPRTGNVGYLEPYANRGAVDAVRTLQGGQYALVPRVVVGHVGDEFVLVPRGTEDPAGDERLNGYVLVATLSNGHRLFRRFP
jgi:hypothetical protein